MSPGAHRAQAARCADDALRMLVVAHLHAEAGGLDVEAADLVEGVAIFADELLAAADAHGHRLAGTADFGDHAAGHDWRAQRRATA